MIGGVVVAVVGRVVVVAVVGGVAVAVAISSDFTFTESAAVPSVGVRCVPFSSLIRLVGGSSDPASANGDTDADVDSNVVFILFPVRAHNEVY